MYHKVKTCFFVLQGVEFIQRLDVSYFNNPTEITEEHYILDKVSAVMLSLLVASKFSIRDFDQLYSSNMIMNATYFWSVRMVNWCPVK